MSTGWIKLHRQLLDWEWYTDMNTKCLYLHCLLRANHSDTKWRGIDVKKGQFITSLDSLSSETGLSIQNIRTSIGKLKSTGNLTSNQQGKARIITVLNWDSYQDANKETNKKPTRNQQGTNRELTTDKNVRTKEVNNKDITSLKNDGFEHWWKAYPKKLAKPAALKSFKAKTKTMGEDLFMEFVDLISSDSTKRYKETEKQFIPNPSTYLNQERYNDEQ